MKRSLLAVALSSALTLTGCDHAGATGAGREGDKSASDSTKRVVVVRPTRQAIARTVNQPANVLALNEATIYAQVAGYLTSIRVDKGDHVEQGDELARIEVPELDAERRQMLASRRQAEAEARSTKAALERAESTRLAADAGVSRAKADLKLQKALFDRAKELRGDGVVSVQDLEIAQGKHEESEASLTLARARLEEATAAKHEVESQIEVAAARVETISAQIERTDARIAYAKITSPLEGIVTRRFVDLGAMIQQATASSTQASPIVTIAQIDRVRVDFPIPEAEVAHVASGQRVWLSLDAHPGRVFEGRVTRFAGALDPQSRTMLVEAEYENKDLALRPGMFGEATLELERHEGALTLPAEALRTQEGRKIVFTADGGVAHRKPVILGLDSGPIVEIASGLSGTESVVVGGGRLTEGAAVVAVERKAETAPQGEKAE